MRILVWSSAIIVSYLLIFSVPALSAASPEVRVGFVDMQRALSSSKKGSAAQREYEKEVEAAQGKLTKKKETFERLRKEFSKQKDSLSESARAERGEKLISKEKDLKRSLQDTQESLRRSNAKIVGELVKQLREVVNEVGEKEGFTMILEKGSQSVLYADSNIDITDKVIKEFDSKK